MRPPSEGCSGVPATHSRGSAGQLGPCPRHSRPPTAGWKDQAWGQREPPGICTHGGQALQGRLMSRARPALRPRAPWSRSPATTQRHGSLSELQGAQAPPRQARTQPSRTPTGSSLPASVSAVLLLRAQQSAKHGKTTKMREPDPWSTGAEAELSKCCRSKAVTRCR